MRKTRLAGVGAATAVAASIAIAVPATAALNLGHAAAPVTQRAAAASSGWVLPAIASTHGNRINTSFGTHCGSSRFGVYKINGGLTNRGKQSAWTFSVALTADGKLHPATKLRFTGYTPAGVRSSVRSILRQTRFHYYASGGHQYIQGVWHGGKQQDLQPFNPVRGNCH